MHSWTGPVAFVDAWVIDMLQCSCCASDHPLCQHVSAQMLARLQHARALSAFGHVSEEERRRIAKAHGTNQVRHPLQSSSCIYLEQSLS